MAAIEAEFGAGMDLNYYHTVRVGAPPAAYGYFNGAGLPQRFIDAGGRLLPIYQATTHWPDEWFWGQGMTAQQTAQIITRMFEAAEQGFYSAFVANIHPCRFAGYGGKDKITPVWPHAVWAYCRDKGIPSWSAEMLLDFLKARNQARFENIVWLADQRGLESQLRFDFSAPGEGQQLTIMVPTAWSGQTLQSAQADGTRVDLKIETIKGIEYGMFTLTAAKARIIARYAAKAEEKPTGMPASFAESVQGLSVQSSGKRRSSLAPDPDPS
jgi:hypothetical protein